MIRGKTVLVTGCSDGSLGSALAIALHQNGWRVIASARNISKLTAVRTAGIEYVRMDVGSEDSIAAAVAEVTALTGGSLDALVNNAGGGYCMPVIHMDLEQTSAVFDLNVFSIIRVTRAFLPLLLKSSRGPIIANHTSGASLLGCGIAFHGAYNAAKAAATSITENLRLELAPFGIRVVNLVTGGVQSTFFQNSNDAVLPADSIYNVAKDAIEAPMNGDQPGMNKLDATTWAKQVARDLSHDKPSYLIFRGALANLARLATLLPVGWMDGTHKKMSGLDVLEQKLREQRGQDKVKKP